MAFVQPFVQKHGASPGDSPGMRVQGLRGTAPSPGPAGLRTSAEDGSLLAVAGAVLGGAVLSTMASRATRCRGAVKTVRYAEPVSGAVAAAAAAKAAGAMKGASAVKAAAAGKAALKTAVAVGGSAGTGSLAKSMGGGGEMYDEELLKRKWKTSERGTPEYKKAMAMKQRVNELEWAARTGRNAEGYDGVTAANDPDSQNANAYDIFMSIDEKFRDEASASGVETDDFDPALCVGVTDPMEYFDPLGFSKRGNEEGFRKLRAAEIKHGRVAMMAAAGAVAQHYVKFPGFEKVPAGLAATTTEPGQTGFIALFVIAGALELGVWTESPDKAPGNFGDPLGLDQYNTDMRNRELNNGRMAMFAAMGIIVAELVTGKDAIEQFAK